MFNLMGPLSRDEEISLAIGRLIATRGLAGLTMRAIAESVGMSLGTLTGHVGTRRRMLRVCCVTFGQLFLAATAGETWVRRVGTFLPAQDRQVWHTRVWLGWRELGRADPSLAASIETVDDLERAELARLLAEASAGARAGGPDEASIDALTATVQGLRDAISWPDRQRMPLERAHRALDRALAALATPAEIPVLPADEARSA